ncbi:hypothetical protein DsansV1_C16g0139061 [Dioscorea sansibarensis]
MGKYSKQRRAVIEALRLLENECKDGQDKNHKLRKTADDCNAQTFKEKLSLERLCPWEAILDDFEDMSSM